MSKLIYDASRYFVDVITPVVVKIARAMKVKEIEVSYPRLFPLLPSLYSLAQS